MLTHAHACRPKTKSTKSTSTSPPPPTTTTTSTPCSSTSSSSSSSSSGDSVVILEDHQAPDILSSAAAFSKRPARSSFSTFQTMELEKEFFGNRYAHISKKYRKCLRRKPIDELINNYEAISFWPRGLTNSPIANERRKGPHLKSSRPLILRNTFLPHAQAGKMCGRGKKKVL